MAKDVINKNYTTRHTVDGRTYVHHYHYHKVIKGPVRPFHHEVRRVGEPGHREYHYHYHFYHK